MEIAHGPDPILAMARAPAAAIVNGPCRHGDALAEYCEVFTEDLQPGLVGVVQLIINLN